MPEYPDTSTSLAWDERAIASGEQTGRVQNRAGEGDVPGDTWRTLAGRFAPEPADGPEDPAVQPIAQWLDPDAELVDVGCGAGRLSVPLAGYCKRVTAIDPLAAMLGELRTHVADRGIANIDIVESTWDEWTPPNTPTADVVLMAHLLYSTHPISEFLAKAESVANRRVVVLLSTAQPIAYFHPLWAAAYGEERIEPLGANEFAGLLRSWNIKFEDVQLETIIARPFSDEEAAVKRATSRLFVPEGSPNYERLADSVRKNLIPAEGGGLHFRWQSHITPHIFSWAPRND